MKIKKLTNWELLEHFKDAVCDYNYNPTDTPYNKSGFTYQDLENEILDRMESNEEEKEGYYERTQY